MSDTVQFLLALGGVVLAIAGAVVWSRIGDKKVDQRWQSLAERLDGEFDPSGFRGKRLLVFTDRDVEVRVTEWNNGTGGDHTQFFIKYELYLYNAGLSYEMTTRTPGSWAAQKLGRRDTEYGSEKFDELIDVMTVDGDGVRRMLADNDRHDKILSLFRGYKAVRLTQQSMELSQKHSNQAVGLIPETSRGIVDSALEIWAPIHEDESRTRSSS